MATLQNSFSSTDFNILYKYESLLTIMSSGLSVKTKHQVISGILMVISAYFQKTEQPGVGTSALEGMEPSGRI